MNNFYDIVVMIGTGVIFLAFFIAILYTKYHDNYMKKLFFIIAISLLLSANTFFGVYLVYYSSQIRFSIQTVLLLLDLIFWCLFFIDLLDDMKSRKIIRLIFACTFSLSIFILYNNHLNQPNLHVTAVLNTCKSVFCILYFQNLFRKITKTNILKEPSFWVVSGLIFYSTLSLPFYGLNSYIKYQFPLLKSINILAISNILIIVMYLFFIKAYLCRTNPHKA